MFLITIQFATSEKNGIRHAGTRRYAKATRREMADWCHAFKRVFLANGWSLTDQTLAELGRLQPNEKVFVTPNPYKDCALAPVMRFARRGSFTFIELLIEECPQETAVEAAHRFLR